MAPPARSLRHLLSSILGRSGPVPPDSGSATSPPRYPGQGHDIFISYNSKNVHTARPVAEWLLSAGLRVWFDEYEILLRGREEFQHAIDQGVARSAAAIAFTSKAYILSKHCLSELDGLLASHLCGKERIVEVRMDSEALDNPRIVALRRSTQPFLFTGDISALCDHLRTNLPISGLPPSPPRVHPDGTLYRGRRLAYQFDLGVWNLIRPEDDWIPDRGLIGPRFEAHLGSLHLTGELNINPIRGLDRRSLAIDDNDHLYLETLRQYAAPFVEKRGLQCHGVHLVLIADRGHLALTFHDRGRWIREYLIDLPDAYGNGIEFAFTFTTTSSTADFYRALPHIDALVGSLAWDDAGTARYPGLVDLQRIEVVRCGACQFSYAAPINWRKTNAVVSDRRCDIDFARATAGRGTPGQPNLRAVLRSRIFHRGDLLNLQVNICPPGMNLDRLEQQTRRVIAVNQGTITFQVVGNRHGVRTLEYLYHWTRKRHTEYGYQIHFMLGGLIFSIQLNSLHPIGKGDEPLIATSAFADGIRVLTQPS